MKHKNFINGQWVEPQSGEYADVVNPATGDVIGQVPYSNQGDVDAAVEAAKVAFPEWNDTPIKDRAAYMQKFLDILKTRQQEFADMIVEEFGTSRQFSENAHVPLTLNEIQSFLDIIEDYPLEVDKGTYTEIKEGYGVVACITPWNYPLNQIQRKVTPALLAGNTVVVKPASITPLTAMMFAQAIEEAGFPAGVFNLVTGSGGKVGDYLASHPDVDVISFTGSTEVGKGLYEKAGQDVKHLVLELGGKSALVYLPGGDLELAVKKSMDTVINNQGQTCAALTRLVVPREELEKVEDTVKDYYEQKVVIGNPDDPDVTVGPMSSEDQFKTVMEYLKIGKEEGAKVLIGGDAVEDKPHYIQPTVFTDATNDMRIAREEIFGPVLTIIPYDSVEEALEIANDSDYGLSGAVVGPQEQAAEFARKMRTGNIYVNDGNRRPEAPFGGYKQSGLGRENGVHGIEDYLEVKAIFDR